MARNDLFRVVVAGGGTGGHVYPTLAVLQALTARCVELKAPIEITRMGPSDGYEALFQNLGARISPIVAGKVRRYASLQNFIDIPKFIIGFIQALAKLYVIMPDIVFSKGGTGALPVVLAAWCYRIPVAIHESDAKPGLTNLMSARFAKKVFVSFSEAARYFYEKKVQVTGTPLRAELFANPTTKPLAKEALGFGASVPLILVLGGSQGSRRVNDFILANLVEITKISQVLHQTGVANLTDAEKLSRAALIDETVRNRYHATGYLDKDITLALTGADLVVARAGSGTLAELAAFGLPAILIPLPESANDHQRINAYDFSKNGAAVVIEEANLLPGIFLGQMKAILGDDAAREKMAAGSREHFVPDAAASIAQALIDMSAAA